MRTATVAAVWLGACLLAVACGEGAEDRREVVVSAAASLTDVFGAVAGAFERANPGIDVVLNFAGSSTLREQIAAGAPVDVFASANVETMDQAVAAGAVATRPSVFARNELQIAVPRGNPGGVAGLEDLADPALFVGLCAQAVPCGDLAHAVLDDAGVEAAVDTEEPDVRALLTKIGAGELDVGMVYRTDVRADDGVVGIEIPPGTGRASDYPIAVVSDAPNPDGAAAFVAFVLSDAGRTILAEHGFGLP